MTLGKQHKKANSDLFSTHAICGCDTVAGYYHCGKTNVVEMLKYGCFENVWGDTEADIDEAIKQSTRFVTACHGIRSNRSSKAKAFDSQSRDIWYNKANVGIFWNSKGN